MAKTPKGRASPTPTVESEQNSERDRAGIALRFNIPTVANGRVYVGAKREVDVYGLLDLPRRKQ